MSIHSRLNYLVSINRKLVSECPKSIFRQGPVYCMSKSGARINFIAPHLIGTSLIKLLEIIENNDDVLEAMAIFWIGFISIHPFENGNGRTAKEYLKYTAKEHNLDFENLNEIDSVLLTENTKENKKEILKYLNSNQIIKETV